MKIRRSFILLFVILAVMVYLYLFLKVYFNDSLKEAGICESGKRVTIALVICGDRLEEAFVMMKSAIVFQRSMCLQFIVVSEPHLQEKIRAGLDIMRLLANYSFTYRLLLISFPKKRTDEWKNLFRPCAAQRLFFPNLLEDVDHVLYVDTDVIFLNELSDIWQHFEKMNSSQISALAPESEDRNIAWYNRFAQHPAYGELGLNSGVMLMNLTKMREFKWIDQLEPIFLEYKLKIVWGDQDIINIIFHYHPEKLYLYSCRYNYRTDHCMYKHNSCKDAEKYGVSVIHGSRMTFHSDKHAAFKVIFTAFSEYELGSNPRTHLVIPMKKALEAIKETSCGAVMDIFIKNLMRIHSS